MATRKRNEWLEAEDSEEELHSESEAEESRGKALSNRSVKRRRIEHGRTNESAEDEEDSSEELNEENKGAQEIEEEDLAAEHKHTEEEEEEEDWDGMVDAEEPAAHPRPSTKGSSRNPLTAEQAKKAEAKAHKTGVVYISRIPPFMKPYTLRHLLQPFGEIGRIFLTPEDSISRQQRVRQGGNKKRTFTDGWVEFQSKRRAKAAAETLNTQIIGGKKGGYYHDDVWNIKYLKGFKWRHLTEQIANENAERAARMRAEISKTTRENKEFVQNVERAKMLDNMEAKWKKKEAGGSALSNPSKLEKPGALVDATSRRKLVFKQNEVKKKGSSADRAPKPPEEVQRVLSKIF